MIVDAHPRDLIIALDPATTEHSGAVPSLLSILCLSVRGTDWWWWELTHRARARIAKVVMPRWPVPPGPYSAYQERRGRARC